MPRCIAKNAEFNFESNSRLLPCLYTYRKDLPRRPTEFAGEFLSLACLVSSGTRKAAYCTRISISICILKPRSPRAAVKNHFNQRVRPTFSAAFILSFFCTGRERASGELSKLVFRTSVLNIGNFGREISFGYIIHTYGVDRSVN